MTQVLAGRSAVSVLGLAVFCACMALGCGDGVPVEELSADNQPLGEDQAALAEDGCKTDAYNYQINSNYCSNESKTSPNTTYDHANCPDQYIVQFTGSVGFISGVGNGWGESMPTTQGTCEDATWDVGVYDYDGTWQYRGYRSGVGQWSGGSCSWSVTDTSSFRAGITKVRLAVNAKVCGWFCVKKLALAYVFGTPCFGG